MSAQYPEDIFGKIYQKIANEIDKDIVNSFRNPNQDSYFSLLEYKKMIKDLEETYPEIFKIIKLRNKIGFQYENNWSNW